MKERKYTYIPRLRYWYPSPEPKPCWHASYDAPGSKRGGFAIEGVESAECPTSVAWRNPQMRDLVHITLEAQSIAESYGSALGSPTGWPGAFYDAVRAIKGQENAWKLAQMKANQ